MMELSEAAQTFNERVAADLELQQKLQKLQSPMEFLALAKAEGVELTPQDFGAIAQSAYQQWVSTLDPKVGQFFQTIHENEALDERLKTCRQPAQVIVLAQECGTQLCEQDLQQAASAAKAVPGFSFEKLWFRRLGLLN